MVGDQNNLGKETRGTERWLAALLAAKWDHQYSQIVGYVWEWMQVAVAVVRSNTLLLRGSSVRCKSQRPAIKDGVVMAVW